MVKDYHYALNDPLYKHMSPFTLNENLVANRSLENIQAKEKLQAEIKH